MRAYVEAETTAGGYSTTNEYFLALIREAQERKTNAQREQLRQDVQHGFAQIERGEYTEYGSGKEVADEIIAQQLQSAAF